MTTPTRASASSTSRSSASRACCSISFGAHVHVAPRRDERPRRLAGADDGNHPRVHGPDRRSAEPGLVERPVERSARVTRSVYPDDDDPHAALPVGRSTRTVPECACARRATPYDARMSRAEPLEPRRRAGAAQEAPPATGRRACSWPSLAAVATLGVLELRGVFQGGAAHADRRAPVAGAAGRTRCRVQAHDPGPAGRDRRRADRRRRARADPARPRGRARRTRQAAWSR